MAQATRDCDTDTSGELAPGWGGARSRVMRGGGSSPRLSSVVFDIHLRSQTLALAL